MKKIFRMALIFLSLLNYFFVHAQSNNIIINGKVTSFEESLGLEGVSINVKGTTKNSNTQADGTFSISISPGDKILVFKLEGYQTEEITISSQKTYDVILKQSGHLNGAGGSGSSPGISDGSTLWPADTISFHHYFNSPAAPSFCR